MAQRDLLIADVLVPLDEDPGPYPIVVEIATPDGSEVTEECRLSVKEAAVIAEKFARAVTLLAGGAAIPLPDRVRKVADLKGNSKPRTYKTARVMHNRRVQAQILREYLLKYGPKTIKECQDHLKEQGHTVDLSVLPYLRQALNLRSRRSSTKGETLYWHVQRPPQKEAV